MKTEEKTAEAIYESSNKWLWVELKSNPLVLNLVDQYEHLVYGPCEFPSEAFVISCFNNSVITRRSVQDFDLIEHYLHDGSALSKVQEQKIERECNIIGLIQGPDEVIYFIKFELGDVLISQFPSNTNGYKLNLEFDHIYHPPIIVNSNIYATGVTSDHRTLCYVYDVFKCCNVISVPENTIQSIPLSDNKLACLIAPQGGHLSSIIILDANGKELQRIVLDNLWLLHCRHCQGRVILYVSTRGRKRYYIIDLDLTIYITDSPPLNFLRDNTLLLKKSDDKSRINLLQTQIQSFKWERKKGGYIEGLYPVGQINSTAPVMIMLHGGPHDAWYDDSPNDLVHDLNQIGFVVAQPNLPGSVGYGDTYLLELDHIYLEHNFIKDMVEICNQLRTLGHSKVFVYGESFGAYLAARCGFELGKEYVSGIVAVNGFFDPNFDILLAGREAQLLSERLFANPNEGAHLLGSIKPLVNITSPPTLLLASEFDMNVNHLNSSDFHDFIRKKNGDVTLSIMKDSTHKVWPQEFFKNTILSFLDSYR